MAPQWSLIMNRLYMCRWQLRSTTSVLAIFWTHVPLSTCLIRSRMLYRNLLVPRSFLLNLDYNHQAVLLLQEPLPATCSITWASYDHLPAIWWTSTLHSWHNHASVPWNITLIKPHEASQQSWPKSSELECLRYDAPKCMLSVNPGSGHVAAAPWDKGWNASRVHSMVDDAINYWKSMSTQRMATLSSSCDVAGLKCKLLCNINN